jgi:hypothetical protein
MAQSVLNCKMKGTHSNKAFIALSLLRPTDGLSAVAGMHEDAQSGEAAHAAYKGGLAPDLARRLHSFLDISANPPALPPRSWNSSEAAAEELFRFVTFPGIFRCGIS